MALLLAVHRPWTCTPPPVFSRSLSGRRSVYFARGRPRMAARAASRDSDMSAADERYRKLQATQARNIPSCIALRPISDRASTDAASILSR